MSMKDFFGWVQAMRQPGSNAAQQHQWQNRNQTPTQQPKKEEPEIEEVLDKEED
jgi:hypothetical protein